MNISKWNAKNNGLTVLVLVAAGAVGFPILSNGALVHRWSFNDGTANDSVGVAHGTLYGTATIRNGRLQLSGANETNRMEATLGEALGQNKTLVAWFSLSSLTPNNTAGGPLGVSSKTNFDSIVYGERTGGQWMNGSDNWNRTPTNNGGASETLIAPDEIMMAITYDSSAANKIKLYRNGVLYAQHNQGSLISHAAGDKVLIGPRDWSQYNDGYMNGTINEARIYDTALTAVEVAALYAEGPIPNPAMDLQLKHRWSFDGTAVDSIGNANGTLSGTATITDGALRLSGSSASNKLATSALGDVYTNKTLVAWCTLDTPAIMCAGSVLGVRDGIAFDAIVYAERTTNQWMNGSDLWKRTPTNNNGGAAETFADPDTIMMTITYDSSAANKINLYRNGVPYAAVNPSALTNFTNTAYMQIGPRDSAGYINGKITEARIYGSALDVFQIAALYAQGPDTGSVWLQPSGGGWDRGANWTNNFTAGGVGNTADFSTLDIASNTVVSLNGSRTIGALVFGDRTPDYDWVLAPGTGGTLTLAAASGAPVIAVSNRTATVAVTLAGTNGFVKTGAGTLNLAAINTYQGPTVVAEGTLNVLPMPYGVVAAYGFDDASNLGLDSSSQSNALKTSQGAPQYSAGGKFGGALYLNGSSLLRTSSGLFPSGVPTGAAPYTVSAYIKAAPTCALTGGWIGYGNNASNRCNNYRLNGTNTSVQNYWYYNDMTASLPSGSFTDGWHSVVGTWNGTDQALYLDGVKQAQRTPATKVNVGTNDFVVGRTTADANFTGWVDEVLIGNRAFTPEEIASLNAVGIRASTLLPAATAVRVAAVATLNLNGMSQTVAGLSGSGSVTNVATLTVSGTLTPGDSSVAPAFLTVSSNLTLAAGATLAFDYTATTSDSVRVTGTLAVQGTNTVVLSGIGSVQPPSRITLFTFGALTGLENLASWSVQGVGLAGKQVRVRSDATSVHVTITPSGTLIRVL